jgi:hypothetical protein
MKTQHFKFAQGELITMTKALIDDPEFDAFAREIVSLAAEAGKTGGPQRRTTDNYHISAYPLPKKAEHIGWHMQRNGRMFAVGHVQLKKGERPTRVADEAEKTA